MILLCHVFLDDENDSSCLLLVTFIYLFIYLFVCLFIYLFIYLFIHSLIYTDGFLFTDLLIYLFILQLTFSRKVGILITEFCYCVDR